ncbi:hypothetical protein C1645_822823, partial [Glomus cerebriforme]
TPKLLADLITKCWDAKAENRPTAKELYQIIKKLCEERFNEDSEIYSQIEECEKIRENKLKDKSSEDKPKDIQTHPQAIYTSRLFNFKDLPEPVNAGGAIQSSSISNCLDCQLSESDLNEDDENNSE